MKKWIFLLAFPLCFSSCEKYEWVIQQNEPGKFVGIPTVFTPDDDGLDDYFGPISADLIHVTQYHMGIYTQGGVELFYTTDYNELWNGKDDKGNKLPNGFYQYNIFCHFEDNVDQTYNGTIELTQSGR